MRYLLLMLLLILPAQAEPAKREKSRYQGGYEKRDFDLPVGWAKPSIAGVDIEKDAKVGFNLHLKTLNWVFDTSHLGDRTASVAGHSKAYGYVHLYVNGRKRNRLYGPDFYLKEIDLDPGVNKLEFVLATPQHGSWRVAGKRVVATASLTRP
ncbi:hypothetical protein ABS71_22320 [bacterium SCN 62-11]|nr:hypothetical protein [Candidatus Eremiobacteraeota bacterium]ODT56077.1 MAG: hypothetical protein ABS71_22320 [bacterium SCN 62-11]